MITISIAKFFIDLVGDKAVQDGEPAGPVLNSEPRTTWRTSAFSLLPLAVQGRVLARRDFDLRRTALQRLAETSPHLLDDIGIVKDELGTYDGRHPDEKNAVLTELTRKVPSSSGPAFGVVPAAQNQ